MTPTGEIILAVILGFTIGAIFGYAECFLALTNKHRDEIFHLRQRYQRLFRMDT